MSDRTAKGEVMEELGRWTSPVSSVTRLSFLADRAAHVLGKPNELSPADKVILEQAEGLLSSALAGERLIAKYDYSVAAGKNFADLTWTTSVFNTMTNVEQIKSSQHVGDLLERLTSTVGDIREGRMVDDEWTETCRAFFVGLRDVVLSGSIRPIDEVDLP